MITKTLCTHQKGDRFASYQVVRLGFVEELYVAVAVGFEKAMLDREKMQAVDN